MSETWEEAQKEELSFWGDCSDTYGEETKQLVYMRKMGFRPTPTWRSPVSFDGMGKHYIDIGGGPCSILLKFVNVGRRMVVDPCSYPAWVRHRYEDCGLEYWRESGEEFIMGRIAVLEDVRIVDLNSVFDIAFVYNVLQHVSDPELIIKNALAASKELHVFEWVDIPPHPGHPHMLTAENLERWTGLKGTVEYLNEGGCVGKAWYC